MPAPPHSSSTVMPSRPSAPICAHRSRGKALLRSISAACGAILSRAKPATLSRSRSSSSPSPKSKPVHALGIIGDPMGSRGAIQHGPPRPYVLLRSLHIETIGPSGGAAEQRGLLVGGIPGRDALERIPQHLIAAGAFIDREIAFEHRTLRPEGGDADFDIGAPSLLQILRGGR